MSNSKKLVEVITLGMIDKKADNIVTINFAETKNAITDYFVICDASNPKQAEAIADSVERFARKELKEKPIHAEGKENSEWIILDYFNVIVHIFQKEFRASYKLEELWADAEVKTVDVKYSNLD
jgi:ribosome-associated protein